MKSRSQPRSWLQLPWLFLVSALWPALATPSELRLVPYSPALARLAYDLGLSSHIVGVTRWTELPDGSCRPIVGDATGLDVEALLRVRPTWIVFQGRPIPGIERVQELCPGLRWTSMPLERLGDIATAARRLLELCGAPSNSPPALSRFEAFLAERSNAYVRARRRVVFVTGTSRPLAASSETYIGDFIRLCGGEPVDVPGRNRWRAIDIESLRQARFDLLLVHGATAAEAAANQAWWESQLRRAGIPAEVRSVTGPAWLIPSLQLPELAPELEAAMRGATTSATPMQSKRVGSN